MTYDEARSKALDLILEAARILMEVEKQDDVPNPKRIWFASSELNICWKHVRDTNLEHDYSEEFKQLMRGDMSIASLIHHAMELTPDELFKPIVVHLPETDAYVRLENNIKRRDPNEYNEVLEENEPFIRATSL